MVYKHGVSTREAPPQVKPPELSGALPIVFGTAAVNLSKRATPPVNEPIICFSFDEAVQAFGYSDEWDFTLSEFIYSQFVLYGMSPVVLVNVLDPEIHKKSVSSATVQVLSGLGTVKEQGVLKPSVVVKSSDGATTYDLGADYELDFDDKGQLVIQVITGGAIGTAPALSASYDKLDPSAVTSADIIGGIGSAGQPTGLELLNQIFPRFRRVPGMVLAPGYSKDPIVATLMTAKAWSINSLFKAVSLTDIPSDTVNRYTDAPIWKAANNYTAPSQFVCYPKVEHQGRQYHLSTQLAGAIAATDALNDNIPYVSPSNQPLQASGAVLEDGTPMFLGPDQAAYLNGEGIVTALNFIGGWRVWGNRTGAYPTTIGPKDNFIPVRRMFSWIQNMIILTYWEYVDRPGDRRLTEAVTDALNLWLNGLVAQGALLGGRVEFQATDNPVEDLADGIVRFHVYATPPSPARDLEFIVEYDAQYVSDTFA
ncbi:phage tail sheath family protein [Paenibacillaceae bacterium]|nr:phage tail sheath family protein [Paenibacillaceae bacterium]